MQLHFLFPRRPFVVEVDYQHNQNDHRNYRCEDHSDHNNYDSDNQNGHNVHHHHNDQRCSFPQDTTVKTSFNVRLVVWMVETNKKHELVIFVWSSPVFKRRSLQKQAIQFFENQNPIVMSLYVFVMNPEANNQILRHWNMVPFCVEGK